MSDLHVNWGLACNEQVQVQVPRPLRPTPLSVVKTGISFRGCGRLLAPAQNVNYRILPRLENAPLYSSQLAKGIDVKFWRF